MRNKKKSVFITRIISLLILIFFMNSLSLNGLEHWPKRVLVTNDNGIDDIKIIELARAFAQVAETYVVAPMEDRSGSTHFLTVTNRGSIKVERRNLGEGIHAYAVDGYPADCVLLAYAGLMRENPPDLVVSGINGGPNLGLDWLFSGTIGAVRVASLGVPAIAVSGLDDDMPDAVYRSRNTLQLNKYLFLRGIIEYNTYWKQINADFLASFTYIPGTVIYLGYGSIYEKVKWLHDAYVPSEDYLQTKKNFFFKASYLWRF